MDQNLKESLQNALDMLGLSINLVEIVNTAFYWLNYSSFIVFVPQQRRVELQDEGGVPTRASQKSVGNTLDHAIRKEHNFDFDIGAQ